MKPIPIPTDVATCPHCDDPMCVEAISRNDDFVIEVACPYCRVGLCERILPETSNAIIEWITRKLSQPDNVTT